MSFDRSRLSPLLFCLATSCAAGSVPSVQNDAPEWRKRVESIEAKYEDQGRQLERLLQLLPRAAATVDSDRLQRLYQEHRRAPELAQALEQAIAASRENADGRYRLAVRCGAARDDGSYSVALQRKGLKPKAKGARIKLLDRAHCPSQLLLDVAPAQLGEGDFRLEIAFDARPQRPYQFSFELTHLNGDQQQVVCSGGTSSSGPPTLSNACDLTLKVEAPSELPVVR